MNLLRTYSTLISDVINSDFNYLKKYLTNIRTETLKSKAPKLIYELDSPLIKIVRDIYNESFSEILVSDSQTYKEFKKIEKDFTKENIVKFYDSKTPLFEKFGIERQIKTAFGRTVSGSKGTYLVIEHTEALHVIDVNSGNRSNKTNNQEETALEVNLIAASEVARQLRLRDMGGIIVIDFIDMAAAANRKKLFDQLFQNDKSRVQMNKISQFGLMELSRQRLRQSFIENFDNVNAVTEMA